MAVLVVSSYRMPKTGMSIAICTQHGGAEETVNAAVVYLLIVISLK